jgi:CheY-like chemotaxis protein
LERNTFDAVLMDVQMPEMDGLEATARLRQRESVAGGHIPVIALTAHAMKGDQDRCLAAGMDAYLTKPLAAARLYETLERFGSLTSAAPAFAPTTISGDFATGEQDLSEATDTFDAVGALAGVGDDVDLLSELVMVFARQAPELIAGLGAALHHRDSKVLERSAHKLKGSLGVLGAGRTLEFAARLEALARAQDWDAATRTLAALEAELPRLLHSLTEFTSAVPRA